MSEEAKDDEVCAGTLEMEYLPPLAVRICDLESDVRDLKSRIAKLEKPPRAACTKCYGTGVRHAHDGERVGPDGKRNPIIDEWPCGHCGGTGDEPTTNQDGCVCE